jgi:hypothetical protein
MRHQLRGIARLIAIVQVFREVRMSFANPMCRPGNNDTLVAVDVMDLIDLVGLLQAAPQSRWHYIVYPSHVAGERLQLGNVGDIM